MSDEKWVESIDARLADVQKNQVSTLVEIEGIKKEQEFHGRRLEEQKEKLEVVQKKITDEEVKREARAQSRRSFLFLLTTMLGSAVGVAVKKWEDISRFLRNWL